MTSAKRRRRSRFILLGILIGLPLALVPLGLKHAAAGRGPAIDINLNVAGQIACLRDLLNDAASYNQLCSRLEYNFIWHLSTAPSGDGFQHTFYFAGQRRNTTRVSTVSQTVNPSGPSGTTISAPTQGFSGLDLGGMPTVQDETGLRILRAALNNEQVRESLLGFLEEESVQSICVQPVQERGVYLLSFTAPERQTGEPPSLVWHVQVDPSGSQVLFQG